MKRILIKTVDKTYYARALTFKQLRDHEQLINETLEEGAKLAGEQAARYLPISLLTKQAGFVLMGLKNHDPNTPDDVVLEFSLQEVGQAFRDIIAGDAYVEVEESEARAAA